MLRDYPSDVFSLCLVLGVVRKKGGYCRYCKNVVERFIFFLTIFSDFSGFDVGHFAKMLQQIMLSFIGNTVMSSFTKRRPLEEGGALADEFYQRLEEKLTADPENYGDGMTLLYTLLTKVTD